MKKIFSTTAPRQSVLLFAGNGSLAVIWVSMSPFVRSPAMNDLSIRTMRPDEISIAVNWAAAEGWNPGLADDACFAVCQRPLRRHRRGPGCTAGWRLGAGRSPVGGCRGVRRDGVSGSAPGVPARLDRLARACRLRPCARWRACRLGRDPSMPQGPQDRPAGGGRPRHRRGDPVGFAGQRRRRESSSTFPASTATRSRWRKTGGSCQCSRLRACIWAQSRRCGWSGYSASPPLSWGSVPRTMVTSHSSIGNGCFRRGHSQTIDCRLSKDKPSSTRSIANSDGLVRKMPAIRIILTVRKRQSGVRGEKFRGSIG